MSVHFSQKSNAVRRDRSNEADRATIAMYEVGALARREAEARRLALADHLLALAEATFDRLPCRADRFLALASGSPDAVAQLEQWLRWASCVPSDYVKAYERIAARPCHAVPTSVYRNERMLG